MRPPFNRYTVLYALIALVIIIGGTWVWKGRPW